MKKNKNVKTILGTTLLLAAMTNTQASTISKNKKLNHASIVSKITDKTNCEDSISDGTKTEHAGK